MNNHLQVGIDIGGSKMLSLAIDGSSQIRSQITTGQNFSITAAQSEIEQFIYALPMLPKSIGIAIPGLVDQQGVIIACDVLPQLVGWQPAGALSSICPG
jgi:glucokinase